MAAESIELVAELNGDDELVKTFQESLKNPGYATWNMTSLMHLQMALTGDLGEDVRQITIKILAGFADYVEKHGDPTVPEAQSTIDRVEQANDIREEVAKHQKMTAEEAKKYIIQQNKEFFDSSDDEIILEDDSDKSEDEATVPPLVPPSTESV